MTNNFQNIKQKILKKKRFIVNKPVLLVDFQCLEKIGISSKKLSDYLPRYILNPTPLYYGRMKQIWFLVVQRFFKILVRVFLWPRRTPVGTLDSSEVNEVYTNEAATYNYKHHLTTRGMDLIWRRMAGWFVTVIGRNSASPLKILDLCTGTGLTIKEMILILKDWDIDADIIGLDYNVEMLAIAKNTVRGEGKIRFVQGEAMDLVVDGKSSNNKMTKFKPNSFDAVTQIYGIGGITEPIKVFKGVLQILKPGGRFFMIDMHKPIPEQPGEWPFLLRWCRFPIFEMFAYEQFTTPIILNRLWAWREPTSSFYLLPLITYQDSDVRYWGFKVQSFEQESQKWWFALPVMPIGKIVVKKVEINEETARIRKTILEACSLPKKP